MEIHKLKVEIFQSVLTEAYVLKNKLYLQPKKQKRTNQQVKILSFSKESPHKNKLNLTVKQIERIPYYK